MNWLDSILAGAPTPEAVEHLQRGFAAWLRSGGHAYDASGRRRPVFPALSACLGLSANPATAALRMRDAYLRHAADLAPRHAAGTRCKQVSGAPLAMLVEPIGAPYQRHTLGCFAVARNPSRRRTTADNARAFHANPAKRIGGFASRARADHAGIPTTRMTAPWNTQHCAP